MKKHIIESPTYGNKEVLVDDVDYGLVDGIKWTAHKAYKRKNKFYIKRFIKSRYVIDPLTGKRRQKREDQYLHKEIIKRMLNLQNKDLKGKYVDHINGNPLDNRRDNLRLVTNQQNLWNRGRQTNNTSGYKGVTWDKARRKWMVHTNYICEQTGKKKYKTLGRYDDKKEAARVYDKWVIANCDEHAYTNFPREDYI